jgi:hypothetical protein
MSKPLDRAAIIAFMRQGYTVQRIKKVTGWNYCSIKTHVILHQYETDEDFGVTQRDGLTKEKAMCLRREIKELLDFNDPRPKTTKIMEVTGAEKGFILNTIKAWKLGELNEDGSLKRQVAYYRRAEAKR